LTALVADARPTTSKTRIDHLALMSFISHLLSYQTGASGFARHLPVSKNPGVEENVRQPEHAAVRQLLYFFDVPCSFDVRTDCMVCRPSASVVSIDRRNS
jgi:hypothetical protein